MKTLKITLLLAVFVLTISALSINKETTTETETVSIEKYQELKKETIMVASVVKGKAKTPPNQ
jgi:hypothetical protein